MVKTEVCCPIPVAQKAVESAKAGKKGVLKKHPVAGVGSFSPGCEAPHICCQEGCLSIGLKHGAGQAPLLKTKGKQDRGKVRGGGEGKEIRRKQVKRLAEKNNKIKVKEKLRLNERKSWPSARLLKTK